METSHTSSHPAADTGQDERGGSPGPRASIGPVPAPLALPCICCCCLHLLEPPPPLSFAESPRAAPLASGARSSGSLPARQRAKLGHGARVSRCSTLLPPREDGGGAVSPPGEAQTPFPPRPGTEQPARQGDPISSHQSPPPITCGHSAIQLQRQHPLPPHTSLGAGGVGSCPCPARSCWRG